MQSLRTLKSTNVHTMNIPEDTSDDHSSGHLGTRYLRKRSMSEGDTETDNINKHLFVVTYDSVDCHVTKNLDSPKNKINESNVTNDNEDTFNFSSYNFSSNDVDKSILKLTSQMKQNLISAKQDFDKYLHKKFVWKT